MDAFLKIINLNTKTMSKNTILLIIIILCNVFNLSADNSKYFTNPIVQNGADPWIVKHSDGYYYYCAVKGDAIGISKSEYLHEIQPTQIVWEPDKGSEVWNSTCIWAPELHFWNGKWYILYSAGKSGPPFSHQRAGVLESETDDPFGKWIDRGMVYTGDPDNTESIWAIDMTMFEYNDQLYCIWSGWEQNQRTDKTPQNLYIAKMKNPYTVESPRVRISSPDMYYEHENGLPINEGPQILQHRGRLFVVYSCGQSWLTTYKLAWIKLKKNKSPIEASSWIKSKKPVFKGTESVFGVGHACFTESPDGKENYIVYHTKKEKKPNWNREVHIQKFRYNMMGNPVFGIPKPAGTMIKVPSK